MSSSLSGGLSVDDFFFFLRSPLQITRVSSTPPSSRAKAGDFVPRETGRTGLDCSLEFAQVLLE